MTRQNGNVVHTDYSGNVVTVTDEASRKRQSITDGLGRLTTVWEPDPSSGNFAYETDYQYDGLSNLLRVDQKGGSANAAQWRTRTFAYDSLSRLTSAYNPESGSQSYAYDANGNMLTKTDARNIRISHSYDPLNRLTGNTYSNGDPAVTYSYDSSALGNGIGRRTGMIDASGSTSWGYDALGRAAIEQRTIAGISKNASYLFNLDGSLFRLTYPSGRVVEYTPGSAGRTLSAIDTANSINYLTAAHYAPAGAVTTSVNGSSGSFAGITTTNSYNKRLQPSILSAASASQTVLSFSYDFGLGSADNGNVLQISNNRDNSRSQVFTYDYLNRLLTAQTSASNLWGNTFLYDAWANLLQKNQIAGKIGGEYFQQAADGNNRLIGYGYDAAGNMTSSGGASYVYDAESRITSSAGMSYTYDGDGRRVKKSNGTIYWTGVGSDPLAESDLSGTISKEFVFVNGKRIARRDVPSGSIHYYFSDHLGSASVVTNAVGAIENESDYYPFGGERIFGQTVANQNYKFTGKERDAESGLDYFGARYYGSSIGRWLSADPVMFTRNLSDPQTLNKYSYAFNKPLVFTDSDGNWPGWYHHILIQDTFGNLGSHIVDVLNAASDWVDSVGAGNQAPERSFMHAMSDGAHNQSVEEAEKLTENYISTEIQAAVGAQLDYELHGGLGFTDNALIHFGHALHTVTDRTSPEHAAYQPWFCLYCWSAYQHHRAEENSAKSSDSADEEARYEAHVAAAQLWNRFNSELKSRRKNSRRKQEVKHSIAGQPSQGDQ